MLDSDMDEMIADLQVDLVWTPSAGGAAQTVTGTASHIDRENDVEERGVYTDHDIEWAGLIDDFTDKISPPEQDTVQISNVAYYVVRQTLDLRKVGVNLILRRREEIRIPAEEN